MAKLEATSHSLAQGQPIVFRSLLPEDAKDFLKFLSQVADETTNTMQYAGRSLPSVEGSAARLQSDLADEAALNLGAFSKDKLVGYLNFRRPYSDHPWVLHLAQFGMMVLKDYWGLGIGKKFLELQEAHALKNGITRIEAMVRVKNERGISLYRRNGYEVEGVRRKAARIKGEFQDEYFIAKILDDPMLKWKPPVLETDRLLLRPVELTDAPAIFEYAKNPKVSEYTGWEPHQSVEDSVKYIKDYIFNYYSKGVPEALGITFKEKPETVIGTVGCFWVSKASRSMELAYALDEKYWGQGIVAEASRAVVDYCFKEFALKRVQSRHKLANKASGRVMEKIGMTYEGTLRAALYHRDHFWDMAYYSEVIHE